MFTAYTVVAVLLAATLFLSAYTKLIRFEPTSATLIKVGVTEQQFAPLAVCETAGGLGLLAALYFALAIAAHLRIGDGTSPRRSSS
jgi:hypothetical protein